MSVGGVLILTQVNFRWIITQRIPSVPYLTTIDKYAIGNLFFLVGFAFWHAIIGSTMFSSYTSNDRNTIDTYGLIAFAIAFLLYTGFHIVKIMIMKKEIDKMSKN